MKSDYVRRIFNSVVKGDKQLFLDIANDVITDEERKNHHLLAKDLKRIISEVNGNFPWTKNGNIKKINNSVPIPRDNEKGFPLLSISEYLLDWSQFIADDLTVKLLKQIIEEYHNQDILATYNLKYKRKILLCGPPGTGKTMSAHLVSSILGLPLINVRFEAIVSSFLGETASNIKKVFNFIEQGKWIVLFDEFDVVGKHRDDPHEHGEIKRVVNNFMQILDSYNGDSILFAATNHPQLLDSALWRRFDEIIQFKLPDLSQRKQLLDLNLKMVRKDKDVKLQIIAKELEGFSAYDLKSLCSEAIRIMILENESEINQKIINFAKEKIISRKVFEKSYNG